MKNKDKIGIKTVLDGRFRLDERLGSGGMSVVFRAHDLERDRDVALKLLREDVAVNPEMVERFTTEACALARLSHENIPEIYGTSLKGQTKYIVMEYIEGISLREYLDRRGALPHDEVVSISEQLLTALEHAHGAGIIHSDITPGNILLLKGGKVKLTDLGIAKINGVNYFPDAKPEKKRKKSEQTEEKPIGTIGYMSPEQANNERTDERSDLYSLGVVMYEMLTGEPPFNGDNPISVLANQMNESPVPCRKINRKVTTSMQKLVMYSLQFDPRRRYQSAKDMLRELRKLKRNRFADIWSPASTSAERRTRENRRDNPASRSLFPVVLGIAFALLIVGLVAVFYFLDTLIYDVGDTKKESVEVGAFVGLTYSEDHASLGLDDRYRVTVEYEYSQTAPKGQIISQVPVAGASRIAPCDIRITVSLGIETVRLPDCTIREWRTAENELRAAGYKIKIEYIETGTTSPGYVIKTDPMPGTLVPVGSFVTLYVSRGIGSTMLTMPSLSLLTEAMAQKTLDSMDISVGRVTYTRSSLPAGTVISHYPLAGESVYTGVSEVDFTVSAGPNYSLAIVPDVLGMTPEHAYEELVLYGFNVIDIIVAGPEPVGYVIIQSVDASGGRPITAPRDIVISISGGPTYGQVETTEEETTSEGTPGGGSSDVSSPEESTSPDTTSDVTEAVTE